MSEGLSPQRGLTLRAFAVGLLLVLVWVLYDCTLAVDSSLGAIEVLYLIGFGAIFTMFVVHVANGALSEERRLNTHELTVIFAMVAVAIPFGVLVRASLEGPIRRALAVATIPHDESGIWLTKLWVTQSLDARELFARGGVSPWDIPWAAWRWPMLYWGGMLLCFQLFAVSMVLFFRRLFIEEEKLPFPMASAAQSVIEFRAPKGNDTTSRRFRSAVVVAFLLGLLVCLPGILSIEPNSARPVPMQSSYYGTKTSIITGLSVVLSWDPFVLCFLMFFPLDVLFTSTVVYVGCTILVPVVCRWLGVPAPAMSSYMLNICGMGGLAGLAFWTVFFNRRVMWDNLKRACRGGRDVGGGEPVSLRVVLVLMLVSFVAFTVLFIAGVVDWSKGYENTDFYANLDRHIISLVIGFAMLVFMLLALMRQSGEAGWHYHSPWAVGMIMGYVHSRYMEPPINRTQASYLTIGHMVHFGAYHNTFSPHLSVLYSLKIASQTNTRARDVMKAVMLTLLIVLVVAIPCYLVLIHHYGFDHGATKNRWNNLYNYEQPMGNIAYKHKSSYFNRIAPWVSVPIGMAIIGFVMYMRRERVGFPFSPVGVVISVGWSYFGHYGTQTIWFPIVIVLVVKTLMFKWFGVRFFRERVIPTVIMAMMGLMTGMFVYKLIIGALGRGYLRPY